MTLEALGFAAQGGLDAAMLAMAFALALVATLGLTPAARWVAARAGIVDRPDGRRKLQKSAVPLLGGVALLGGFASASLALATITRLDPLTIQIPSLLVALVLVCLLGLVDDVWNLPARHKLAGQVISVLPIIGAGIWIQRVGFCGLSLDIGYWGLPLSIVWFIACTNAVNLLDGMDGLASTIGLCIALGVASIGLVTGADATVVLALVLAGSLAGFLVYNRPPATIYLGDAGSMVIGLLLAVLTLQVGVDSAGRSSLTVMAVLMAVPIADTTLAVVRRGLSGQGIWRPDRGHLHHRLLERGFRPAYILRFIFLVCALTGGIATVSRVAGWDTLAWCACGALAVLLVRARLIGHHEWSLSRRMLGERLYVESFDLPQAEQLRAMSFDLAWSALVQVAQASSLDRMQLCIDDPHARRHHEWRSDGCGDFNEERFTFEVALRSAALGRCRLRMESAGRETSPTARWQLLAAAARRFAEHWAMYPESVPITGLRIFSDEHISAAAVEDRDARRAA
jgi:UDP-GlcNAc:undecaprenyl-phosphate GlcNAc-1-phosphate transferase